MDGIQHSDPFEWDVDAVSEQLCTAPCRWARDTAELASKVQTEEVDGRTLLTYADTCQKGDPSITDCLGITSAGRRNAFNDLIFKLKSRSPKFRKWARERAKEDEQDVLDETEPHDESDVLNGALPLVQNNGASYKPSPIATSSKTNVPDGVQNGGRAAENPLDPSSRKSLPPIPANDLLPSDSKDGERLNRKRVAPINLVSKPVSTSAVPVPTEADAYFGRLEKRRKIVTLPWEDAPSHAYLGDGSLSTHTITSVGGVVSTRLLELGTTDFALSMPNVLPPGRRLVVHREMKRLLRENGHKTGLLRQGHVLMRSESPSEDEDPIIDLFDLPDSLDEQTLQEMADEKLEDEREKALHSGRSLTQEHVQILLGDAIESMSSKWQETKLPKHERKAHKIWTDARRRGTKTQQILNAQRHAQFYDDRIRKLCRGILAEKWLKEAEVKHQARCLEQNLFDKLHQMWLVKMLESRTQPQKPHTLLAPRRLPKKRPESLSDGEVLTSSDEDDFIVQDDEADLFNADHLGEVEDYREFEDPENFVSVKPELSIRPDPITIRIPVKSTKKQKGPEVIDLTTPTKPKPFLASSPVPTPTFEPDGKISQQIAPPIDGFEAVEEIGEKQPAFWTNRGDRWRLAICLIYRLSHARRTAILQLLLETPVQDIWRRSVKRQISEPLKDPSLLDIAEGRLMAFDCTRIFRSFTKVADISENRIAKLSARSEKSLKKSRVEWFPPFCEFFRDMAPRFPQESQIFRTDIFDDEIEGDDEGDEDEPDSQGSASQSRKPQVKEIVQNKEAVDLRERQVKLMQEQKARQLRLRATLATSDFMARDKSRLIINESKQEDQPFIYVNEEIGRCIKDHQIDGVRFLWNQIVQDPEVRQGCLLAHTMGLGKTMQVITLLVALQEAGTSTDPLVRGQIPPDLRGSKALVLCPAGLVDNWMDELLLWAPGDILGTFRKVDAALPVQDRPATITDWVQYGGVLIIGYNMFKMVLNSNADLEAALVDNANIVIADEAHVLKNPNAKITQACSKFRTKSRIALTGSPLANNVEEYHSMIEWVAPNFLGPLGEFRDIYARPIQAGLWTDSLGSERRRAIKMLQVLKETVAPKVSRATIQSLKGDLPDKSEFVISVPPTELQEKLYMLYVNTIQGAIAASGESMAQGSMFSLINDLGLICNHPRCFRQKVQDVKDGKSEDKTFPQEVTSKTLQWTEADHDNASLSFKTELLVTILDESRRCGDKVLVFSQSLYTLQYLEHLLRMQKRRVCRLDGSTAVAKRQDMVKDFNRGNSEVWLISTTAGGVGLNIHGANRVVIFDSKWNPVNDQQAIGRAYRIGQTKPVFVYRFIVAGTFEEDLQNKSVFKTQLASRVVDKKNPVSWAKRLPSFFHHIREVGREDLTPFLKKDMILDKLINKTTGRGILAIVSTDTFEEEDPTGTLTAAELQETENMVSRNRLRLTDPEEFERRLQQEQAARLAQSHALHQTMPVAHPSMAPGVMTAGSPKVCIPSSVSQTMDGTNKDYVHPPPRPLDSKSTEQSAVPLPIAGTNTFFGQQTLLPEKKSPAVFSPSQDVGGGSANLWAAQEIPVRNKFEEDLERRLIELRHADFAGLTKPSGIAQNVTLAIANIQKEKKSGFLPDNSRWRFLNDLLQSDRFVLAMASGSLSSKMLALEKTDQINNRVSRLERMSPAEFRAHLGRQPDPQNLDNIRRPSYQSPRSARALEDMKAMREAADNRRERSFRLPSWAKDSLNGDNGQ